MLEEERNQNRGWPSNLQSHCSHVRQQPAFLPSFCALLHGDPETRKIARFFPSNSAGSKDDDRVLDRVGSRMLVQPSSQTTNEVTKMGIDG